jgi:sugar lactone lactonase YvrE
VETGKVTKVRTSQIGACVLVILGVAGFVGCGGGSSSNSSSPTPPSKGTTYAVADNANDRVLLFQSPLSTGENANIVLGQRDSISSGSPTQLSASTFAPQAVAADSSGNLYVSDAAHCRILQFQPPFSNDMNASLVIGAPSLTTASSSACTATPSTFGRNLFGYNYSATGMAFDASGNLWVSDYWNSRVLEYTAPFSNGMSASIVIGQTNMTGSSCNQSTTYSPTASTLCSPSNIAFDSSGDLWIVDERNNRVLEFKPPFSAGMSASLELGQPSSAPFTSSDPNNPTTAGLDLPTGLAFDSTGNIWVADSGNNRVVKFGAPYTNGMASTLTLSSPATTPATQIGLSNPTALSFDSSGNLLVVDTANNRVMIYAPPFAAGMNGTLVLGQITFLSGYVNAGRTTPSAYTLAYPISVAAF